MELYKSLCLEFHEQTNTKHHLLQAQYKKILDQLTTSNAHRANIFRNKEGIYRVSRYGTQSSRDSRRMSRANQQSERGSSKDDIVAIQRKDLLKKISEVQHEIKCLRTKTADLNGQLQLFQNKTEQIEIIGKRSQLEVFNARQNLSIELAHDKEETIAEQLIISKLQEKRSIIAKEIDAMVRQKEQSQAKMAVLRMKYKKQANNHIRTQRMMAQDPRQLRNIVSTMLQLEELLTKHKKESNKENKSVQTMRSLSLSPNRRSICGILQNFNNYFDDSFVKKIVAFYNELQNEFDRLQRANKQLNNSLNSLNIKSDQLDDILRKAHQNSERQAQQCLKQTQYDTKEIAFRLQSKTSLINHFTSKFFYLLRRLESLAKTANRIVTEAGKDNLYNGGSEVVEEYEELLNKNQEQLMVKWSQQTGQDSKFYSIFIQSNDLLRTFAIPENFNKTLNDLTNYQIMMSDVLNTINTFILKMSSQIVKYFKHYQFGSQKLSMVPLSGQITKFCVEANDYYRRDDYRLLEKLRKIQMKKKGLLADIPDFLSIDQELNTTKDKQQAFFNRTTIPKKLGSRNKIKYTELASRREQTSTKSRVYRKLFGQLEDVRIRSQPKFTTLMSMRQSRVGLASRGGDGLKSLCAMMSPRKTVGFRGQKQNTSSHLV